jgi:hypothetical protein
MTICHPQPALNGFTAATQHSALTAAPAYMSFTAVSTGAGVAGRTGRAR